MNRNITMYKALGIIAVVNGHLAAGNFGHHFYLFHIPLFFFITGSLYKEKYTQSPLTMVKQRIKGLYVPYVLYSLAFISLRNLFVNIGVYTPDLKILSPAQYIDGLLNIIKFQYGEPLLMAFWFIPTLFFAIIIFSLTRNISEKISSQNPKETTFYIVTILVLIGFFLTDRKIHLPLQLDKALIATSFVYLGYLYSNYGFNKVTFKGRYAFLAVLALVVCGDYGAINMDLRMYSSPPFYIGTGLIGIYFTYWLGNKLATSKRKTVQVFEAIGSNTFPILTLHLLAFKVVTALRIYLENLSPNILTNIFPGQIPVSAFWQLVYTIAGVLLPLIVCIIAKRIVRPILSVKTLEQKG